MIIDIMGTMGAGKSTLAREMIKRSKATAVEGGWHGKVAGYAGRLNNRSVFIVGDYRNECGGCDGGGTKDYLTGRIRWAAGNFDDVIFEGIIVTTSFGTYANLLREIAPTAHVFAFLHPPLDECLRRVEQRRLRRGDLRPLNPRQVMEKHRYIDNALVRARIGGVSHVILDWRQPLPGLNQLFAVSNRKRRASSAQVAA